MKFDYRPYLSLVSATAFAQLFVLLVSPVVTRLYTQEEFGAFGLLLGAGALVGSLAAGRLELAIPAARSVLAASRRFLLGTVFIAATTLGAVLVIVAMRWLDIVPPAVWAPLPLYVIPVVCFALAMFQLTGALLLWHKNYRAFGMGKVTQGLATGSLQLGLGFAAGGTLGLVFAQTLGYLAAATVGLRKILPTTISEFRAHGAALAATIRETRRYSTVMVPAALFNQASQQLPLIAISHMFGLFEAGLYTLTYRICAAPLGMIGQAVAQVYASEFRDVVEQEGSGLQTHLLALTRRLFMVGTAVVGSLVAALIVADRIYLFGAEWSGIGIVALCLAPLLLMDFIVSPLSTTLAYVERQWLQLAWDVTRFASIAGVFGFASWYELSFWSTLALFSLVWAAGQVTHFIVSYGAAGIAIRPVTNIE